MKTLDLKVRYTREIADSNLPQREENFTHGYANWQIPTDQTALVLVDCWDDHHVTSFVERAEPIAREKILPVTAACRRAGITVIHAPAPNRAVNYPEFRPQLPDDAIAAPPPPADWPPADLVGRTGPFAEFAVPNLPAEPAWRSWSAAHPAATLRIFDFLGPEPGDFVVADAPELHALCRSKKILHLIYVGFATNICVQHRDYGMRAMRSRGYNLLLLRDCTTGIEFADSVAGLWLTRASILDIEVKVAPSITSAEFLQACGAPRF